MVEPDGVGTYHQRDRQRQQKTTEAWPWGPSNRRYVHIQIKIEIFKRLCGTLMIFKEITCISDQLGVLLSLVIKASIEIRLFEPSLIVFV